MDRRVLDRVKQMLLAKRGELSVKKMKLNARSQLQEGGKVILSTEQLPLLKRSFRSACIKPTVDS